ncbi:MAG: hypothetical protein RR425_05885, partial [Erysipelotrichales bacterium]
DPLQSVEEVETLIKNLDTTNCFFSSNHVSNYLYLKGNLPQDRDRLLKEIDYYKQNPEYLNLHNKRL